MNSFWGVAPHELYTPSRPHDGRQSRRIVPTTASGVVFADGIKMDNVQSLQGHTVRISVSENRLNLVVPTTDRERW